MLIAGDLTDYGLPEEARVLAKELELRIRVPVVAVLGNHDVESGKADEVRQILTDAGMVLLDGDACELHGIGIAGVKGFGGGFGKRALGPWGETDHQAVRARGGRRGAEARSGAGAAAHDDISSRCCTTRPIQQTVEGEPLEIYPFLGSSRLEEPIERYPVTLVVHGHAHRGQLEGAHQDRRARLQRLDAAAHAIVRRSSAVPRLRAAGWRRGRRAEQPQPPVPTPHAEAAAPLTPSRPEGSMETSTARSSQRSRCRLLHRRAAASCRRPNIPFLVGGAFAFSHYSRVPRDTKDIDVFVKPDDCPRVLDAFEQLGYETEVPFPHWLGKIHDGEHFMDVIFSSGNGVARVDDLWFEHAPQTNVLGVIVRLSPVEEMIWSKAFIQERERFDGADVLHLLRETGPSLDWPRLLMRFGDYWRVLLSHLILFGFAYPDRRQNIPSWVMDELAASAER